MGGGWQYAGMGEQVEEQVGEQGWVPPADAMQSTRVGKFMASHDIDSIDELRAKSVADIPWFWDAVVRDLRIPFSTPYTEVLDETKGVQWAKWFVGGKTNMATICVDQWADATPNAAAVVWEGEDGATRTLTYAQLRAEADGIANLLSQRGIGEGDAVGIFLPMLPETVAAVLGIAKLGAVFLPLFSGYGASANESRLRDSEAKALITCDGTLRRGKSLSMLATARDSVRDLPAVHTIVVVDRLGLVASGQGSAPVDHAAEVAWPSPATSNFETRQLDSEHTLFVAYTSGTTGTPKGSVHTHAGWTVKVAEEGAYQCDVGAGDVLWWFTDLGWIMGPWQITAGLANGATIALFEGAPDFPEPDRAWQFVESHKVTMLGMSPTLIRALIPHGELHPRKHDLSSLRILGSTGEPWNADPWWWYFREIGGERCPIINLSGGTEVGACFLSPHPVEAIRPCSLGGPSLGLAVDVYGDDGKPLHNGSVGELVCTRPWPGMTRGLFKSPERYIEAYWSRWPEVWVHGDWASIDSHGQWYLHGRSDDTIKIAGKRVGPAEVESALVAHPDVVEAVAVGVPHEVKGEQLWCYVVLGLSASPSDELREQLRSAVADTLGSSFRPAQLRFTTAIPKTRSAKLLRRAVRAVVTGADPGDLSSLDDPSSIEAIRSAV